MRAIVEPATPVNVPERPLAGLRVAVLTSGHEALDGRIYTREACSLQELGADVVVVGMMTKGRVGSVPVLTVPAPSSRLSRFLLQPWRCLWAARRLRPDIVHIHDAEMLMALPLARVLWPRAKFVYDVHEDFGNLMLIRDWLPKWIRPLVRTSTDGFERLLSRLAHGIVAVTPPLEQKFPHAKRVSALNFATAAFFESAGGRQRPPRDRKYDLVHLGTLTRRRAEFLGEVVRALHAKRPGARTLIFGGTPEIVEFLRPKLPAGCELLGKVSHDQVPALLGDARVGLDVHPWADPHLQPALAVKVCEYMACGCAVVASSMPVLDAILSDGELEPGAIVRITGGDPSEYAEAVVRIVAAIEAGKDPGAASRSFALEHMSWAPQAAKIASLYRELVDR